jgi:hypothetical protein
MEPKGNAFTEKTPFFISPAYSVPRITIYMRLLEVDLHGCCGGHALGEVAGRELTSIVDDEVGLAKTCELFLGRADQRVVLPSLSIKGNTRNCGDVP